MNQKATEKNESLEDVLRNATAQGIKDAAAIIEASGAEMTKFIDLAKGVGNAKNAEDTFAQYSSFAIRSTQKMASVIGPILERNFNDAKSSIGFFKV